MTKVSGQVNVFGRVAYAPQQPWILTDTIEGNIAFGGAKIIPDEMDHAIQVTMLQTDLAMLPAGSKTQIGEKGVNLSGGQKARVALGTVSNFSLLDDPKILKMSQ
jgi:ABC-type multidrug transport system fused ATPase/permease subunit